MRVLTIAVVLLATAGLGPALGGQVPGAPGAPGRDTTRTDTTAAANARDAQAVLARLGPDADRRADSVFRNVKLLGDMPARRLVGMMNGGYSRALGVRCTHCHVANDYASDEKREKKAAREMIVMHRAINESLRTMQHLETPPAPTVSCSTCHRGNISPPRGGGGPPRP